MINKLNILQKIILFFHMSGSEKLILRSLNEKGVQYTCEKLQEKGCLILSGNGK